MRRFALCSVSVCLILVAASARPRIAAEPDFGQPTSTDSTHFLPVGSAGCSSSSCHGSPATAYSTFRVARLDQAVTKDAWKNSAAVWSALDPHTNAYRTLESTKSQAIIKRLYPKEERRATRETSCLACHANPTLANQVHDKVELLLQEGVSCEACHGNASAYRFEHPSWNAKESAEANFDRKGLARLNEFETRAANCLGCHVGAPATATTLLRDVTHDMIAAGHPRLNFDFATYLRALPIHWDERERKTGKPRAIGFEESLWQVGRWEQVRAELNLLADRAQRGTWPELAAFNCYSCHHEIKPGSWRGEKTDASAVSTLKLNDPALSVFAATTERIALAKLAEQPHPDPVELRKVIAAIGKQMKAVAAQNSFNELGNSPDWDQAQFIYSSLVARHNAKLHAGKYPQWEETEQCLTRLHEALHLPKGVNSPVSYTPEKVSADLRRVKELLK